MEHSGVSEAAVVLAEIDYRSRIKAFVILSDIAAVGDDGLIGELQEWCKAELQRHEFPHVIDFVDDFPRTATGKVQRFKLRDD
jgi:benzoate-CoA ligase